MGVRNMIATMTSKGQVTVPRAIREHFHIRTGDKIDFVIKEDGTIETVPIHTSLKSLKGILPRPAKKVTLEDMEKAIGTGRKHVGN
ncbi:MAG: AbrB/MazE/SpoVT family DNA-binding domain-containing protein [Victivallales bacterium]